VYTYVAVEANENCPMSANQVYKNLEDPFPVSKVRIYEGEPAGRLYAVVGWTSQLPEGAIQAYAVRVEDSSEGAAYLVYGGDWGLRLRPSDSTAAWSLEDADQFGETHLVLAEEEDLVRTGA
jgi:hypothetical protein